MDIATVKTFFMWCTIINMGLLILSSLVCVFLRDFSYRMNNLVFSVSREAFNAVLFGFIAFWKIVFIVFNLVPHIALTIMG